MKPLWDTKRCAIGKWFVSLYNESQNGEKLFLSVFFVHVIFMCLGTTMFKLPHFVFAIEKYLTLFLIMLKIILFDKYDKKQLLFGTVLLVDSFLVLGSSTYQNVLIFSVVLLGCKDVDFVKILKLYAFGTVVVLLAAFVASRLDVIEDLVYTRIMGDTLVERNSFGTIYPTDFAAHIFFLLTAYYYLMKDSLRKLHLLAGIFLSSVVYIYCYTRLDSITMLLLIIGLTFVKFGDIFICNKNAFVYRFKKLVISIIPYLPVMGFLFMYFMSYFFQANITIFRLFDTLLSGRLRLGNKALEDYRLTLFGQPVLMNGNGGSLVNLDGNYFFIDCSYLYVYLRYGIIFLLLVFLIHYLCCKKFKEDIVFLTIVAVIAVNCAVAHHMVDLAYNPFYLAILAKKSG